MFETLKRPFTRIFSIMVIFALLLGACAPAAAPTPQADRSLPGAAAPAEVERAAQPGLPSLTSSSTGEAQTVERIIVKNASLSLVVADPVKSMDAISGLADEMGGFVVSANLYQTQLESGVKVPRASIKIRVPVERLNEALTRIKAESDQLPLNENVESQDYTSDYTDLQSRLRNLENTEAQLTKIMDSATKTEDVLNVYNQLVQVREQIEVTKGRIKYYDESAAMSAIAVELIANEAVQPLTIGRWQPAGVAKTAVQTLINTLKFLANAAIWLVIYILPVLLILFVVVFLPVYLLVQAWRRRRTKQKKALVVPPASEA